MTARTLHVAKGFVLPLEAVTQTFAILGKRGSGKTTTATVLTEELLEARQPVVVIDPLDVTWGLRSSRDGKATGYPITVLGGDHADLPLEASAGVVLADFVVEQAAAVVLSLRHFSMNDQRRFVTDFCERLYALKGKQANRTALHVVIDEVDEFAHQRIPAGHERLFGAIDRLVRRGRASGIGVTMISQRPAVIHKDILSQAEVLICHQTISPQDRKALEAWIESHDAHDQRAAFMESISGLQRGEAWVWSPGWLDLFTRVQIRDRLTFDSSATPKAGERVVAPKAIAVVNLEQLQRQMAATIEKAKADDPRELRKQIAELKADVAKGRMASNRPDRLTNTVEKPVLTEADRALLAKVAGSLSERATAARETIRVADHQLGDAVQKAAADYLNIVRGVGVDAAHNVEQVLERIGFQKILGKLATRSASTVFQTTRTATLAQPQRQTPSMPGQPTPPRPDQARDGDARIGAGERKILTAIAQYPAGVTREQLSVLTGYKRSSRDTYLQRLSAAGLIESRAGQIVATDEGFAQLGAVEPLPTGDALREHWLTLLPEGERKILQVLCHAYPKAVERDAIHEATGYKRSSRDTYLQRLGARKLITIEGRGAVRAAEELFS